LLLSAVSGESQQDRTDRDMLAPWLKFVWESYKQCLDLLKNNNRVEKIYQEVAQMGFRFCQQYNRRPEFRKLCDTIRTHFTQSQKYSQQMYSVNFQLPETQALHLETRLVQLDTAIAMELWQEAFKAVEDIHAFTTISKKTPRPQQLASYYNKVALVFWKAGNYVFHATTVLKLYVLHKEQKKNITHAELSRLSTKALLSILSIPLPTPRTQIDEHLETDETINEKQKRLTSLLSLQQIPTRASLIRDMIKQGVLNFVYPELKNMYEWLEVEFNPLKLSSKMEESIQFVEKLAQPEYSQYMSALRDVTVVRLLQQISQVYQTIELKRFIDLAPPMDKHRLEKIIVNAAKNNDVQVRIEHKSKALTFGTDLSLSSGQLTPNETGLKTNIIQKMPNEQIRNQLISISRALYSSMEIINDKANKERNDKLRREIAQTYYRDELIQRKEILKRRELIERYKEEKEKESISKIRQAEIVSRHQQDEREKEDKSRREADQKRRLAEAALEREKEEHRFNMKIAIDKLRESEIGRKIIELIGEEELYKYDPESLNSLHIDAVIKYSREQKEKLKIQYKKVDFLIRALHETEIPLMQKQSQEEIQQRYHIQLAERERAIERRERLIRMENDKKDFLQSIRGQRHEDFVLQMQTFEQRLHIARQQRLEQLRREHIEKKKQDWKKQKQLEKQQKENEKQQKIQAELRRQEVERLAKMRAETEEKNKKLDEQAKRQRQREEEVERKLQEEREASRTTSTTNRRSTTNYQDKDKTDSRPWRRPQRDNEDTPSSSYADSKDSWRNRNEDQRPRGGNDRRLEEPSMNKGASSDSWKLKSRTDQQNRDDRRGLSSSSSQQQQQQSSPSSSDRRTERNSEAGGKWQTVEKKRPNPSRTDNDRPSYQRPGESSSSSSGFWKPKARMTDEARDNPRSGSNLSENSRRPDESSSWRTREKQRLNSWRANESDDENERPSSDNRDVGGNRE
ncbi:unnamed protein product, partial [Rotaria sordida]